MSQPVAHKTSSRPPPALVACIRALPEAAVLTRDTWSGSGVEIAFANEKFCTLTGYSAEELRGRPTHLLHGPKTDLATLATRRDFHRLGTGSSWLHRRDGTEFYATWTFGAARPGWLIGLYRDISETKRLQEVMLHSQKLETVGHLTGGVAHDFNNLLSIINGYCEIMRSKLAASPAAQKDLQEIHRAGQKAASLARQLLEFSRRQDTEARVVNANTLIREIADIIRRVVGEGVQVELRLASDLGNTRVDPTQLQQALLNLCFNARDAMPQGGKLTLRTSRRELPSAAPAGLPPGAYVVISVTDTGLGMDEATQHRIFEPFFTTKPHGTGLGLPTVQSLVRHAGGAIGVQSTPGGGTTFELFFPETAEAEQIYSTAPAGLPSTRGTERLWLIEADDVLRKMVAGILSVDGYQVREFSSVAAAKKEADSPAPQLLLLDQSGPEACALALRLHARNASLRALFLTVTAPAAALPAFSPQALTHLPKPFALSTLLRAVRGLLDARLR